MRKIIFYTVILCFAVLPVVAQQIKPAVKIAAPKAAQTAIVKEVSTAEWKILTDALQAEDWKTSALLASKYLGKLKTDNEKKQMARLRYFYLYAVAGKILAASTINLPSAEIDADWKLLDKAISDFTGKEFVLPPRQFKSECKGVLNYICSVKSNDSALRITATNKIGTMIHSFDYILFDNKLVLADFAEKELFLGGKLNRAEFNQDMSKPWVMRLFFEKGFVSAADRTINKKEI